MRAAFGYFLALAAAVSVLACGCSPRRTAAQRAANRSILLVGNSADPASLDPSLATGFGEFKILSGLFEGLVCADTSNLSIKPAVAKSWNISDDGRVYTFILDESARWSDGTQVCADDFAFAWRRALDPAMGSEYASMLFPIKNARAYNSGKIRSPREVGVRAVDTNVLRVELEKPTPYFLSLLYHNVFFPLPKSVLRKFGAAHSRNADWTRPQNMVCNGPFTLQKWTINDRITLKKNPLYRAADKILLEGVEFFPISNINTEDRAFRAGQLHITDSVSPPRIPAILRQAPQTLRRDKWLGVYYYLVNTKRKPLDDPRVRKALSLSIDRRAIIDSFLKAGQPAAYNFTPSDCGGYSYPANLLKRENIDEAKKLLADAGYPEGKNFPAIRITYNTSEQHKPIAEAIRRMWRQNLGIEAELYNLSWPAYLAARSARDFDVARASWVGDFAAPESFLEIFLSDSGLNHSGFADARFDAKMSAAASAANDSARFENLADAEKTMLDQMPVIPIYFYSKVYRISPAVKGWNANLLDYHNFHDVYLDPNSIDGENGK